MSSIYLTGDVLETADLPGLMEFPEPDWRTHALSKLQRYGVKVVNPIVGAWATDAGPRVRRALDLIDQCDAVLANLKMPGYGTPMEIFYAHRRGKMVTVVGEAPFSPWVLSHSMARFQDIDRALNFIIEEFPKPDLAPWCMAFEAQLSEHYEQLPVPGEMDYQFMGGDLPVLVFAPHATAFFKEGEFQDPEMFTGCMAAALHRTVRCHSLMSNYCSVADPIWHLETPMIRALADVVKAGQVGLIVMLLGSPWHDTHGFSVQGYGPDGGNHEELASRLRLQLSAIEPVGPIGEEASVMPFLRFASEALQTPVVAVRTHRRYRMPRLQPEPFEQALTLIAEFVQDVGVDMLRSRG